MSGIAIVILAIVYMGAVFVILRGKRKVIRSINEDYEIKQKVRKWKNKFKNLSIDYNKLKEELKELNNGDVKNN